MGKKEAIVFLKEHYPKYKTRDQIGTIYFQDVVVVSNTLSCTNKGHKVETLNAVVYKIKGDGSIVSTQLMVGYCFECMRYYVLKRDVERATLDGKLLCILQKEGDDNYNKGTFSEWNKESLLHQCGYNVNATEGLTSIQRHTILEHIVDAGLMSPTEICSYLDGFISLRSNNSNMRRAIAKWEEDRNHIRWYKKGSRRSVAIMYED